MATHREVSDGNRDESLSNAHVDENVQAAKSKHKLR